MTIDESIKQYGKRLYGLCLTLCADKTDADDLYQDTWLKVVRHIAQYDSTKNFEPWLTRICVNTYRNRLRRRSKSPIYDGFSSVESKDAVMETVIVAPKKDYSDLHDAINRLPEKLRVTIILFYFKDMDLKSTADLLSIPAGTVKSRLNKAKKLLKEALKHEYDLQF